MRVYTMGVPMPKLSPVPIPTPLNTKWWNIFDQIRVLFIRAAPRKWKLEEDYCIVLPWLEKPICIPKGFVFDGASVPRPLWMFISPTGVMFLPGLFHDFGYRYRCYLTNGYKPIYVNEKRSFFDINFKKMGTFTNNAKLIAPITWFALLLFGMFAWGKRRKENHDVTVDYPMFNDA